MYWLFLIIILIIVLIFLFLFARKARDKLETRKVVQLSLKQKKNSVNKQTCSFCRKKAKRLHFYSSESGQVLGVCDQCKPQAERRALMRI
ncbi:uncharacterized membrane-anchored protein YhcB (DUF1043 family) [Paenibacillus sp. V4I3]|nr:uncharacterized membrane-anchored protein YhcB (DUF1043 family) [Paenibacillus sp. V4I3]